jgi:hypothetical protein
MAGTRTVSIFNPGNALASLGPDGESTYQYLTVKIHLNLEKS